MENTAYTPFLKQVASYINEKYSGALHELHVIFPNKRARIYFNSYLAELNKKPVFSPRYYTISEYITSMSDTIPADQFTLIFTLFEVYKRITNSPVDFDNFLFYCEMILADFDDIDKNRVNPKALYQNLSDLKELDGSFDYLDENQIKSIREFWETFSASVNSAEKQSFESYWMVMLNIYEEFNHELNKQNIAYEGKMFRQVIEKISDGKVEFNHPVLFIGFNALSKCEYSLFRYLKNNGRGVFFWDTDDYYMKNVENHEAARFLIDLVREFPRPSGFNLTSALTLEKTIEITDIPTQIGQAKALAGIFEGLPESWKQNPSKTAIALADESLLLPVLTSLPEAISEVNISMGFPVKHTLAYSLTGILLELHQNKKIKDQSELFYYTDILRLIQHNYIQGFLIDGNSSLAKTIHRENLLYVDRKTIFEQAAELEYIFVEGITPRNFIPWLIKVLQGLSDKFVPNDKNIRIIEEEAVSRICTQLNRMADIFENAPVTYSFRTLIKLTGRILKSLSIPFSGEPLTGVQVMGVLETRTLDFDNLIVLSLNEGVFPKSGNVPTLIPYSLRKAYELPTVEHQDSIYAYYFYRLLQRAKHIHLVYSSSVSESQKGEASRYILQLLYEKTFQPIRKTLGYVIAPQKNKAIIVRRTPELSQRLLQKYSGSEKNRLSPSAINSYLNCQLRFYYQYIAGIPEPAEVIEEVQSNTLGSILHKCMNILYDEFRNKQVSSEEFALLRKNKIKIEDAILQAFWSEFLSPLQPFPGNEKIKLNGKNLLVKEVIARYIERIVDYDMSQAPIFIRNLEDKFATSIQTPSGYSINIGGTIDRIDETGNRLRIIDYKTGAEKLNFESVESLFDSESNKRNGAAFQVLLYSLIYHQSHNTSPVQPALFFIQNMLSKDYDGRLKSGIKPVEIIDTAEEVLQAFEPLLKDCLDELFASEGYYMQTSDEKRCEYCPYAQICGKKLD